MLHRFLILFILTFIFPGILYFSCCPEERRGYSEIIGFNIYPHNGHHELNLNEGEKVYVDSLGFNIFIQMMLVSETEAKSGEFLYALTCPDDYSLGLKNELESIKITADKTFGEITPGNSLNHYFIASYRVPVNGDSSTFTINEWKDQINKHMGGIYEMDWKLEINGHHSYSDSTKFFIQIEFADSSIVKEDSGVIYFKN